MTSAEVEGLANLWLPEEQVQALGIKAVQQAQTLEQYKLYVEMADRVSERRLKTNSFFQTLHSGIFAAVATVLAKGEAPFHSPSRLLLLFPICVLALLCFYWFRLIRSFDNLNSVKFKVIGELESRLPASPWWRAEWHMLSYGKNRNVYWPFTKIEVFIPVMIGIIYLVAAVVVCLA